MKFYYLRREDGAVPAFHTLSILPGHWPWATAYIAHGLTPVGTACPRARTSPLLTEVPASLGSWTAGVKSRTTQPIYRQVEEPGLEP